MRITGERGTGGGDNIKMDGAFCELDTSGLVEIQWSAVVYGVMNLRVYTMRRISKLCDRQTNSVTRNMIFHVAGYV